MVRKKNSYQTVGKIYDLSGSYSYENENIVDIQPMRISKILSETKEEE